MSANGNIVVIDFGLARKFVDAKGVMKVRYQLINQSITFQPPRTQSGFHGTTRYASPRTHRHEDMGRCDDLWPVFFVMLEMAVGQLPWRSVSDKGQVLHMKVGRLIDRLID
jgi:tau tubulin kinase